MPAPTRIGVVAGAEAVVLSLRPPAPGKVTIHATGDPAATLLLSFGQGYGAMSVLSHDGARWSLRRLNEEPVVEARGRG